ncbi:uncharacterized protein LOC103309763 [Acyrthosiphon pisum]|uniref:MULE transposase domain-containing protein n=1 Tax=Acyrthosiphon pisum TaxID=7029 RepID=A0A8R2B6K7_ACYPI|nr:uncharacterized protein LOC103309763 [Acyrthosiphon pisum]|eukprot:XP_008184273.1 PREDICTED: uncharacterized protein LOC103309763 [Acyrthosiphon pisum]
MHATLSDIQNTIPSENFRPTVIVTDFETALREMLIRHFPTATAHGCWFHINQSLKMLMVLPLLPARRIEEGFIEIKQYAVIHGVNLRRLFNYYERFWLRKIGPQLISVYKKKIGTNNNIESFHNKLRQTFQTSHPNIWAFLSNICKLSDSYLIKINQIDNGLDVTRNTRSKYLANDLRIKTVSRQLRQGLITIKMFLLKCSYSVASYEERMRAIDLNINEEDVPENVLLPEGQGNQNDEELAFEDNEFVENVLLPEGLWDETYGNDEVNEIPYYAPVPENIDVFPLQNEEEMCIVFKFGVPDLYIPDLYVPNLYIPGF